LIAGAETVHWGTTFHNWIKTWYAPVIFRPHLFLRGCRLLFGDHAMFFRRADFLAVGGCDETLTVMGRTLTFACASVGGAASGSSIEWSRPPIDEWQRGAG
jgi:hypothetical protein